MDSVALARALARVRRRRATCAMAVVATAGTTDFGAIDPLPEVAALCHARTTPGCTSTRRTAAACSPRAPGGTCCAGIERADSVTVDFHKTWFQPVSASALLVRDGATSRHVTWHADYLNPKDAAHPNQVDKSLQTTRRFDALKLWMTLRIDGRRHDRRLRRHGDRPGRRGRRPRWRPAPDVEVAARPTLTTIVFRYRPDGLDDDAPDALEHRGSAQALYDAGPGDGRRHQGRRPLLAQAHPAQPDGHRRDMLVGLVDQVRRTVER